MGVTNLKAITSTTIKQGDFSSKIGFRLVTEDRATLNGSAKLQLMTDQRQIYERSVDVRDNCFEFTFDEILPFGVYQVEVEMAGYVFPSYGYAKMTITENVEDFEALHLFDYDNSELRRFLSENTAKLASFQEQLQRLLDKEILSKSEIQKLLADLEPAVSKADFENLKAKVASLPEENYNDSELRQLIAENARRLELRASEHHNLEAAVEDYREGNMALYQQIEDNERAQKNEVAALKQSLLNNLATKANQTDLVALQEKVASLPQGSSVSSESIGESEKSDKYVTREEWMDSLVRNREYMRWLINFYLEQRPKEPPLANVFRLDTSKNMWELHLSNGCYLYHTLETGDMQFYGVMERDGGQYMRLLNRFLTGEVNAKNIFEKFNNAEDLEFLRGTGVENTARRYQDFDDYDLSNYENKLSKDRNLQELQMALVEILWKLYIFNEKDLEVVGMVKLDRGA